MAQKRRRHNSRLTFFFIYMVARRKTTGSNDHKAPNQKLNDIQNSLQLILFEYINIKQIRSEGGGHNREKRVFLLHPEQSHSIVFLLNISAIQYLLWGYWVKK